MKQKLFGSRGHSAARAVITLVLGLSLAPAIQAKGQKAPTQAGSAVRERRVISTFTSRARSYVELRNGIRKRLPKLSKDSTPEQIAAHKKSFEDAVRAGRVGAKQGEIFTADAAEYIRRLVLTEFKASERREVKETILEADTAGIPLRVNYPYPETKEFAEVPATLLLKLPQLPKEVNYRFAGRHLLLVDKDNGLILDYMLNALP